MKRRVPLLLFALIVVLMVLTSCYSSIGISTLVPAKVDVSGYKTIAVRSTTDSTRWLSPSFWNSYVPARVEDRYRPYTKVWSMLDFNTSSRISRLASNTIYSSINNGFFKVIGPDATDGLVSLGKSRGTVRETLMKNDIDAILSTDISSIYYDEYITEEVSSYESTDSSGSKYHAKYFYLVQQYAIVISYTLTDVENNSIIATGMFTSEPETESTMIGRTINAAGDYQEKTFKVSNASTLLGNLVMDFSSKFRAELSPHYETIYFDFMPNKNPRIDSLEKAYDAVDDGNYSLALKLFEKEYSKSKALQAGYNAAILKFANGDYEGAYAIANEVYEHYGNSDVLQLIYKFRNIQDSQQRATEQINSDQKSAVNKVTELIGF